MVDGIGGQSEDIEGSSRRSYPKAVESHKDEAQLALETGLVCRMGFGVARIDLSEVINCNSE